MSDQALAELVSATVVAIAIANLLMLTLSEHLVAAVSVQRRARGRKKLNTDRQPRLVTGLARKTAASGTESRSQRTCA